MELIELKANTRKGTGKGSSRELRRQGLVPAVLYGPKTQTTPLTISEMDLVRVYKASESEHVVLRLVIENGGIQEKTAMIKEAQVSPLTRQYLHIDFYEISMDQELVVKVPLEVTGKSKGVDRGGLLQLVRHELEVACLPGDIPGAIRVDVSDLDIGDALHIEDIAAGDKLKFLFDTNFTVVTVVAPTVEKEAVPEEALEGAEEAEEKEAEASEPAAD